jgi:hypothetical protein
MISLFFLMAPIALAVTLGGCLVLFSCFVYVHHSRPASSILWAPVASYALAVALFLTIRPVLVGLPVLRHELLLGISYAQGLFLAVCLFSLLVLRRALGVGYTRRLAIADAMVMIGPFALLHSIGMIAALSDCVGYPETDPPCYML